MDSKGDIVNNNNMDLKSEENNKRREGKKEGLRNKEIINKRKEF